MRRPIPYADLTAAELALLEPTEDFPEFMARAIVAQLLATTDLPDLTRWDRNDV